MHNEHNIAEDTQPQSTLHQPQIQKQPLPQPQPEPEDQQLNLEQKEPQEQLSQAQPQPLPQPQPQPQPPPSQPQALPAQYAAQYPPTHRRPWQRRAASARSVLFVILCFLAATAAGFAGGYVANRNSTQIESRDEVDSGILQLLLDWIPPTVIDEPNETATQPELETASGSGKKSITPTITMTVAQVATVVRDCVVEIKTETVSADVWSFQYVLEGAGSGVIITDNGYIITNNHVISDASTITVRLVDGREYAASVYAFDVKADIAIIKIDEVNLPSVTFGNSSDLVVGESAIAVGNPLGELGGTVTGGIISALDREIIIEGEIMTLLQTDAAVNHGNSGGGLFNMRAELIGIVNAKSSGLSIEGLGFAIPSDVVKSVASDLLTYGYVRGRIETGLELLDVQSAQQARWNRFSQVGLYIVESAHDELQHGDRITGINDVSVLNLYEFNKALGQLSIGDTVTIFVIRRNAPISASIVLTEWKP